LELGKVKGSWRGKWNRARGKPTEKRMARKLNANQPARQMMHVARQNTPAQFLTGEAFVCMIDGQRGGKDICHVIPHTPQGRLCSICLYLHPNHPLSEYICLTVFFIRIITINCSVHYRIIVFL